MRRILMLLAALAAVTVPLGAPAASDDAARAARWSELRAAIFGDRLVEDGAGLLALAAPSRADDAALVPVTITVDARLRGTLRHLYLVIDDNPSPLAARYTFGPRADTSAIATRVRVDDYTYLHAVAETNDGRLYAAAHFIKASGGCSAPAGKDQIAALERLGRMKLTLKGRAEPDKPVAAQLLVSHPNNSGMQMDQVSRLYVPADFVRTISVRYEGELVLRQESDISISEDPALDFAFVPTAPGGTLTAEVEDSSNRHFRQSWPVKLDPGS
jgi:sulfur-oxidizing protein SoxY